MEKNTKRRTLTPQEKKLLSYAKDRRNSYGEAGARSRFSIARNKTNDWQRLRHGQNSVLKRVLKSVAEDEIEKLEAALKSVKPRRWRKCADWRLGQCVAGKILVQEELGMKENPKRHRILAQAQRKWRKMFRYDRWGW